MSASAQTRGPRTRRTRTRGRGARRGIVTVLVIVLVLAVVAVAADVVTRKVAEDRFATILQGELGMDTPPAVSIGGVPFLTQLASREFSTVHLSAPQSVFTAGERQIPLEEISLDATSVTASDDWSTFTVGEIDGSARMPWAAVSEVIGAKAEHVAGPNGEARTRITHTIEFQDVSVPVVLVGTPAYDPESRKLVLNDASIQIATYDLPADLVQDLLAQAMQPIDLGLPQGVEPTSIESTGEGMRFQLAGSDVRFE